MAGKATSRRVIVDGMSCASCEQRIEKAVGGIAGVHKVTASSSLAEVRVWYDPSVASLDAIHDAIRSAGYTVREEPARTAAPVYRFLGLVAVIAALFLVIRYTVGFTFLPAVSSSMGYGLIFIVGLLTSLHCIAMCGGIVLSQTVAALPAPAKARERLAPGLLYNGGRVISYTIIGGIVGAVGSLFSLSTTLKGVMPVVAGAFMLFLGVRMLGVFPWLSRLKIRLPGLPRRAVSQAASRRGPFVVGLLNGLMPCGPLQTMQVYALGTGSFFGGALSMFLFSLGTVPLLLGFGAISSLLSAKFNRRMVTASGVLVMVLGVVMFARGMNLFGVALPTPASPPSVTLASASSTGTAVAKVNGAFQEVRTTVGPSSYQPFIVQKGIPVRWILAVKPADLNSCNGTVTVPRYDIRKKLVPGDNVIEFTPDAEGTITYTCWMGMITSTITVVGDLAAAGAPGSIAAAFDDGSAQAGSAAAGCCGTTPPRFAGGGVPVDVYQVASRTSEGQEAVVTVDDNGYTPALIVMQKGVKGRIRFVGAKLSSCNYLVDFPEYRGEIDLAHGQSATPYLDIDGDFTFQCGMGMLHGYVKVVDNTARIDVAAIKREVAAYRPAVGAGGCCGR